MKRKIIILIYLFGSLSILAQTKTNLDQFYGLIEKSIIRIDSVHHLPSEFSLTITSSPEMEILKNTVWEKFSTNGRRLSVDSKPTDVKISYSLINGTVSYNDLRKDGFFGGLLCDRGISLKGSALITNSDGSVNAFEIDEQVRDVVNIEEVKSLEVNSLPFTQGQIPQPSFFSNLLEPVIVIGTLVGTVILLFTVRGK